MTVRWLFETFYSETDNNCHVIVTRGLSYTRGL